MTAPLRDLHLCEAAALAAISAGSFAGIPAWPYTQQYISQESLLCSETAGSESECDWMIRYWYKHNFYWAK